LGKCKRKIGPLRRTGRDLFPTCLVLLSAGSIFSISRPTTVHTVKQTTHYIHIYRMPAAISKPRNKGKARADPYEKITASMPLGKQLAHTGRSSLRLERRFNRTNLVDKKVRDQAIRNLTAFVSKGDAESSSASRYSPLSDAEMSKLWKGLFYCRSISREFSHIRRKQ
jgi:hypothetical protein